MSFTSPAPGATETRTDQGVDWSGVKRIVAVAQGKIVNVYQGLSGFGTTIIERLGTGQEVYYAEESGGGAPQVRVGQAVQQGQTLAPGTGGVIEAGFWDPSTGRSAGAPGYREGMVTAAGTRFRNMIGSGRGSGAPVWRSALLTWYDPALGGINTTGGPNPTAKTASGEPYDANADTCAAPPQYAFGTMIAFKYGGKTVTCKVNDRGGAIQGNHFDLSRHAADTLGIVSAGAAHGQYAIVSGQGAGAGGAGTTSSPITRPGGDGTQADSTDAVQQILANYEQEITLPRSAAGSGFTGKNPFGWWWQSFTGAWQKEGGQ